MEELVECLYPETKSNVVEWIDATGWSQEMLFWLLAWIEVVESKDSSPSP